MKPTMRAVAVEALGGQPRLMDLPKPVPGPGEVLVRVSAAGVNPLDWKIASGRFRGQHEVFPLVLGSDGAGRVESLGEGAHRFQVGDRIFGQFLHDPFGTGTYAEYTVVPEQLGVTRIPDYMSDREAAALPTAGMTALVALDALHVEGGTTFLVVGASGGIGSFALPLARTRGARVLAVARATSAERLRALGADEVIDPNLPGWEDVVRASVPQGVDAALDLMSDPAGFLRTMSTVRPGGRAGSPIGAASPEPTPSGAQGININLTPTSALLERLVHDVKQARLTIPIQRTARLEDVPGVLADIQAGRAVGKVVIDVLPPK